ncbi:MAG: DUF3710 domain-containing protein [Mycobacteriaceae bacterium]
MIFGRRNKTVKASGDSDSTVVVAGESDSVVDQDLSAGETAQELEHVAPPGVGPYDSADVFNDGEDTKTTIANVGSLLDLGSVVIPLPEGGQIQVEMTPAGQPHAVHLVTAYGRISVAAYAAPKSPGQWREVAKELADSLRVDGATVAVETGPWGREVVGDTAGGTLRFIGVDGFRWMVRCVASGPAESTEELAAAARAVLQQTIVRRGTDPHPVRTPLPLQLPEVLLQQLAQAQVQAAVNSGQQVTEN